MTIFDGVEFDKTTMLDTGRVLTFQAIDIDSAVSLCLYMERLADGKAFVGPTGRVVHQGNRCVVFAVPKNISPKIEPVSDRMNCRHCGGSLIERGSKDEPGFGYCTYHCLRLSTESEVPEGDIDHDHEDQMAAQSERLELLQGDNKWWNESNSRPSEYDS